VVCDAYCGCFCLYELHMMCNVIYVLFVFIGMQKRLFLVTLPCAALGKGLPSARAIALGKVAHPGNLGTCFAECLHGGTCLGRFSGW
jgi:hypothetical protein